jgi:FHA domain
MTIAYDRPVRPLKRAVLTLQFYKVDLQRWSDLGEVHPEGQVIGRSTFTDWDPNPESLAEEHLRLAFEGDELLVQPLPSLNGAYLKLRPRQPVELEPYARFRVGHHVLEYRPGGPPRSMTSMCSEDGEVFQSRVLAPLGFIDLIGLDQEPYLTFPLTKAEELPKADERGTRIGREGPKCDIALSGDAWVSAHHARIVYSGEKCLLEDLESTNGTFLMIREPTPLRRGSPQKPDTCDVVLIGGYLIRVIEERV